MYILFRICCGIIYVISLVTGLTYEEVNTVLFIYAEPAIVVLTSLAVSLISLIYIRRSWLHKLVFVISIPYNMVALLCVKILWMYYSEYTLQTACEQAYKDLELLGQQTGVGYVNINLFLFIVLFLFLLFVHISACVICYKYKRPSKTEQLVQEAERSTETEAEAEPQKGEDSEN